MLNSNQVKIFLTNIEDFIFTREQDQLKYLIKQRTSLPGLIHEVERFKTWWSNDNVATIITINGNYYWVFLGVIDRKPNTYGKIENNEIFIYPTNHNDSKWGIYRRREHDNLTSAEPIEKPLD